MRCAKKLVVALAAGLISTSAFAGAIIPVQPYEEGVPMLPRIGSDYSSINIGFDINFFGKTYSEVYVNDNGSITFDSALGCDGSTLNCLSSVAKQTFIAPFFGNASRGVTYGETVYDSHRAFAAQWWGTNVSGTSYAEQFQVVLVDRSDTGAGNFDFVFNFDSAPSVYGASGSSFFGYGANGSFYEPMTGFWDINLYPTWLPILMLNSPVSGRYVFAVRGDVVIGYVPEPETWAMLLAGLGIVGIVARKRRVTA
ncbi:MAG: PEPxxWA-CTERM sorting domain-containing protein [Betaproteobacteria bacterium]|nr:PEPxxWA-CTERM sorting domain-containing protein [Betaproteobacteria bacterium]